MPLSPEYGPLLDDDRLVDPKTFEVLVLSDDGEWLEARASRRRFPIVEGIPRLIEEAVQPLDAP